MGQVPFIKYHGAGNDFVLIDLIDAPSLAPLPELARYVCDRRQGIGADGLLLVFPSQVADFKMDIYNADGSHPALCGNGIRCLVDYLQRRKGADAKVKIETGAGILSCRREAEQIAVNLGTPFVVHWPIELDDRKVFVVNTGVPHAVLFVDDLDQVQMKKWGPHYRFHPCFSPDGVNVNFAKVTPDGEVAVRTYERGVEGETLACGTGAAAAAYAAMRLYQLPSPVKVLTRSHFSEGEDVAYRSLLQFFFPEHNLQIHAMEMVGGADLVFEGTIELPASFIISTGIRAAAALPNRPSSSPIAPAMGLVVRNDLALPRSPESCVEIMKKAELPANFF